MSRDFMTDLWREPSISPNVVITRDGARVDLEVSEIVRMERERQLKESDNE